MKLIDDDKFDKVWSDFQKNFNFDQGYWFKKQYEKCFNLKDKVFKLYMIDDKNSFVFEEQFQKEVNSILSRVIDEDIYAIDPFHDVWEFNPSELQKSEWSGHGDTYGDIVSNGFPCYYPNGEDFFFVTKDFSKGILFVPGFGETYPLMFVVGQELIDLFEKEKQNLSILDFDKKAMENYN